VRKPLFGFAVVIVALLCCPPVYAQSPVEVQPNVVPTMSLMDDSRVLLPDRAPQFLERSAYQHDATIADLLSESRLKLIDNTIGIWLQRSETGASILALGVEPVDDTGTRTVLLIVSVGGSDYPILTDAPLGSGSLRLQLLGTNEAIAVQPGNSGLQIARTGPFDPIAKNETTNALRGIRSEGLSETLSCLVGVLFSNFGWSEIACAVTDYTICVVGSAGAGLVSCSIAFKQLLPDCSSTLPSLTSCFNVATDTSAPSVAFGQPASGANVSGSTAITASVSDNALKAVVLQVDYQTSSGRRIALVADSQSVGGCSLSTSSATCSTQFNFGQAVNGSSATIRVTATDTAGNIARVARNVTVSSGPQTYSISGNAGSSGVGISGCNQSTQTDASGNYTLNGCLAGTYTVAVSKSGCTFTPASRSVTVGPSATGVNFSASCGATLLANGQTITSLTGDSATWRYYRITVPSGQSQLKVTMSGGTGDADLYVRRGAVPTLSAWDYRPWLGGNNEIATITNPASGDWYIGIYAYSTYTGVSLNAAYAGTGCTTYSGSLPGTNYVYYIPTSSGYSSASSGTHTGKLTGTGIDFDLYLQKYINAVWTTVSQSTASGSAENVSYSGTAGMYRWRVLSYSGSGTFSLCVTKP
jgi:hypothetical protein